ncbi:MAG: TlpA disulfide reductase family protein [Planctomycetota bacterium]
MPTDATSSTASQPAKSSRFALLVAALGLALVGTLALTGQFGTAFSGLVTPAHASANHALVGQKAPAFAVRTLDGRRASSKDAVGSVLVIDFWATWCPPCVRALPIIKETVESFEDSDVKVHLVAMNLRENKREIEAFLENQGLAGLNVGLDTRGDVAERYLVEGIPQTVVIDPTGMVTSVHVGLSPKLGEELTADINAAIEAGQASASAE